MSRKAKDERPKPEPGPAIAGPRPAPLALALALVFGLFLGLCIWKFGNPVILDQKIASPGSSSEFLSDTWPTHWANGILLPIALIGMAIAASHRSKRPLDRRLWLLPLLWFGWQVISATRSVDIALSPATLWQFFVGTGLTAATLWQFFGCIACYFLGAIVFAHVEARSFLLFGILAAFAFCLVRAVDQKFVEFPNSRQLLIEGGQTGWTNLPPGLVAQLKHENVIITTNGVDVANPAVLAKFEKGRVMGTLVYPNALAGLTLLLFPVALVLARSKKLRPAIRGLATATVALLGLTAFYSTGSKAGWLIALVIIGVYLFRLDRAVRLKTAMIIVVAVVGLGIFSVRFHSYFAHGATSVGARFDYWRAAVQTTVAHPFLGTGPGTFQRPYARIKSPDAEMARLAHNDYLEQFSDSGIPGGILYMCWIVLALFLAFQKIRGTGDPVSLALFLGVLGWFLQGFAEFSLYIPALAWTAFTLLGCLVGVKGIEIDKKTVHA